MLAEAGDHHEDLAAEELDVDDFSSLQKLFAHQKFEAVVRKLRGKKKEEFPFSDFVKSYLVDAIREDEKIEENDWYVIIDQVLSVLEKDRMAILNSVRKYDGDLFLMLVDGIERKVVTKMKAADGMSDRAIKYFRRPTGDTNVQGLVPMILNKIRQKIIE